MLVLAYKEMQVAATFGVSAYGPVNTGKPKELLHHADMARYEGEKRYNKNCVVTCTESGYKKLPARVMALAA